MQKNTLSKNRQAFYLQLESIFAGRELENFKGKSGFANLLSIKSQYFKHIKKELESKIKKTFNASNSENELYIKAFTFFDSFLNETGCPYFNKTEFYKNLYEKVYTNSSDTALFYKTSKLYYVKSDSVPSNASYDIKNDSEEISRAKIIFEVSDDLKYSSTNEKKELKFILKDLSKGEKSITLLVIYKGQKVDLGDDYSFELNSKIVEKKYELISSSKTNLNKFDELLNNYLLDITPNEVSQAIYTYKKQREIDFFIHKDASTFLKEQFNLYMYNYLFNDNEIEFNDWDIERLQQVKNIKEIIFATIELVSKFEDELRAMWLKPKFVRNLNYIITLDKIDTNLHDEIFKVQKQVDEWKELELTKDDKLIENEFLPVDTKYLSDELKYKILSSFDNLDEITDGLLIKSDNFQALNTILPKYKEKIKCIYTDPPYNTAASEIIYKNNFKHSTWLTLLENRISIAKSFLSEDGLFEIAIDDEEHRYLNVLLDEIFNEENFLTNIAIQHNPRGRSDAKHIAPSHEYLVCYAKNMSKLSTNELIQTDSELKSKYNKVDSISKYRELPFKRSGSNSKRTERPNLFYPIFYSKIFDELSLEKKNEEFVEILPLDSNGMERCWRWNKKTFLEKCKTEFVVKEIKCKFSISAKDRLKNAVKPKSMWFGAKHDASSHGTMLLKKLLSTNEFDYPKSINTVIDALQIATKPDSTILDFFAGSGTTAHATMELNKQDLGNRKFLLIEMGNHFDTVLIPRIKKITEHLKISQLIKYYELETYEDVLGKAQYSLNKDSLIDLYKSEKLANDKVIKKDDEQITMDFKNIYDDIDIFETISNVTGFKIKKLYKDRCLFLDGDIEVEIKKDELLFREYPFLRKLIWWR